MLLNCAEPCHVGCIYWDQSYHRGDGWSSLVLFFFDPRNVRIEARVVRDGLVFVTAS